jgi:two-component sensor histidine kinase
MNVISNYFKYFIICILFTSSLNASSLDTLQVSDDLITKIEDFIIAKKLDSANYYIQTLNIDQENRYVKVLRKFCLNEQDYSDYYQLAIKINNRPTANLTPFINYVTSIPVPVSNNRIVLDYVYTQWLLITKLRNYSEIDKASFYNNKLKQYIDLFDERTNDVKKANLLLSNHQVVLYLIEGNVEKGKALCTKNLSLANKLQDSILQIVYLNHLCDFLIEDRDIDGFIKNSELSLSLESESSNKSPYYIQTLEKLIDAYLFKGGFNKRVYELLNIIYSNKKTQKFSYSLYANFLRNLPENSNYTQKIFTQFNVNNYISFCNFIEHDAKNALDQNQYYFILDQASKLLETKGFLKEAIDYKTKCVQLTRKIYSEDLSNSLANYRTETAIKNKEIELEHQKEKYELLVAGSILSLLILAALVFAVYKKNKQRKLLKTKNTQIIKQRDALRKKEKEKDLLLKEVHHRVKNNFQIVSSLLELQSKEIKDPKARELAFDGRNRIKSMALIHQKLYQNESNLIEFDEYLKLLVSETNAMYSSNKSIETFIESEKVLFDVDTAIPLGLIVNELVTNAYKHAFETNKKNDLTIKLSKEIDKYKLVISDNGPGLKNNIDVKSLKSLGLKLVSRLVKQLQGTLIVKNQKGAYFEILFKDKKLKELTK